MILRVVSRHHPIWPFAGVFLVLALPVCALVQSGGRRPVLDSYRNLVDRYRSEDRDDAIRDMLALSGAAVNEAVALLEQTRWPTADFETAALLHIEAALAPDADQSAEQLQVNAAWRIADFDRGTRLPKQFQSQLFLLFAWQLQAQLRLQDLAYHLDKLITRFPRDAEVLLALGSFYEVLGWSAEPAIDLRLPVARTGRGFERDSGPKVLSAVQGRGQRRIQEEAVSAFRRALVSSPTRIETQIRLARTLTELDRPQEALNILSSLRDGNIEGRFRYWAALFEGAAQYRLGHFGASVEAYRAATRLYANCQTPWVGLSNALRATGASPDLDGMLSRIAMAGRMCDDPWWEYKFGQAWQSDARLAELRQEVAR